MRTFIAVVGLLLVAVGCAAGPDGARQRRPQAEPSPVTVHARTEVEVASDPLGDMMTGTLSPGQEASAYCFVTAHTMAGQQTGTAIMVQAGELSGFAPVTDFPRDGRTPHMLFDVDEITLKHRIARCRPD